MKWPWKTVLWIWTLSPVCTAACFFFGWSQWEKARAARLVDPAYRLTTLIQTGPEKEALKSDYFAELLGLCVDRPLSLYAIDLKSAEKKLRASPLLEDVSVERRPPNALYIDYTVRRPIARLADYANTLIDEKGHLFPMTPFFPPKELPEIYLGLGPFGSEQGGSWEKAIDTPSFALAKEVLALAANATWKESQDSAGKALTWWNVKRVDVSHAFAPSLGQREIVLLSEEHVVVFIDQKEIRAVFPKILRLAPKTCQEQLAHFSHLQSAMLADYKRQIREAGVGGSFAPRIVDLRLSKLAFVQND